MKAQKKYSPEMKAEAVKMVLEQGLTHEEAGRRLTIPKGSIGHWVATARAAGTSSMQTRGTVGGRVVQRK